MEVRVFGGTGIRVSRYCLGAMMFGAMGNRDESECIRIVHAALDAGVNFVDTSDGCVHITADRDRLSGSDRAIAFPIGRPTRAKV